MIMTMIVFMLYLLASSYAQVNNCDSAPCTNGGTCTNMDATSASTRTASSTVASSATATTTSTDRTTITPTTTNSPTTTETTTPTSTTTTSSAPTTTGALCTSSAPICYNVRQNFLQTVAAEVNFELNTTVFPYLISSKHNDVDFANGNFPCYYSCQRNCSVHYPNTGAASTSLACSALLACTTFNSTSSTYVCTCPAGWTGATCAIEISYCTSSPCANGGTCVNAIANYSCTCAAAYSGRNCEYTVAQLNLVGNLTNVNSTAVVNVIAASINGGSTIFNAALPSLLSVLTAEQRVALGFSLPETILDATYEGQPIDPNTAFYSFNDPSLGNCFTFNHWNLSVNYIARDIGERGGLRVKLDIQPQEYCPWVDTEGINVYVHSIGQDIYLESKKTISRPGGDDTIIIARSSLQLTTDWVSKCAKHQSDAQSFYFSGDYSVDGCFRSCYQDACYSACGCMDPTFVSKPGIPTCNLDQSACIATMSARRGDPYFWPECHCLQPCNSEDFALEVSRVTLNFKEICYQTNNLTVSSECVPTQSYATILFSTLEIAVQVQEEKNPFLTTVLGNIGNVGGLLLGFSLVCLFELLIILCNLILEALDKSNLMLH